MYLTWSCVKSYSQKLHSLRLQKEAATLILFAVYSLRLLSQ